MLKRLILKAAFKCYLQRLPEGDTMSTVSVSRAVPKVVLVFSFKQSRPQKKAF